MEAPEFVHVTSHVSKLDLPLFADAMRVGVWLVESDDGWTLVDTASPGDAETIDRAARARTAGQVPRRIVLTHGHYDHAGSLRTLWERWSIPVLVHRAESPFVLGKAGYGSVRPAWWGYRLLQSLASEDFDHLLPSHGQPILQTGKAEAEQAVALITVS